MSGVKEKKTKGIYEARPKITTPKPQSFLVRIVPQPKKSK
jgi:hypothetical protein